MNVRDLLILLVFSAFSCAAIAGPKEDALEVMDKWAKAFSDSDVNAIVKLYTPDALFLGNDSKTLVSNPEGIRRYFEPPSPAKNLWTTSSFNSVRYFFMKPREVRPTSGGQFKPGPIQSNT